MNKNENRFFLKNLVTRLLKEETSAAEVFKEEKGQESLDSQVDKYFSQFESEASESVQKNESLFRRWNKNTFKFLFEADEEDEEGSEETSAEDDAESDSAAGDETPPPKMGLDSIDPYVFANGVARLIENYETMLEVKNTLLRRSLNFIRKSYKDEVVDEVKRALEEEHSLEVGKSKIERDDDQFQPPAAQRGNGPAGGSSS